MVIILFFSLLFISSFNGCRTVFLYNQCRSFLWPICTHWVSHFIIHAFSPHHFRLFCNIFKYHNWAIMQKTKRARLSNFVQQARDACCSSWTDWPVMLTTTRSGLVRVADRLINEKLNDDSVTRTHSGVFTNALAASGRLSQPACRLAHQGTKACRKL